MKIFLGRMRKSGKGDDAVSEAIGFILIFSLVMMGIGLITLYGYPLLLEQQSNANIRNMERDMIVIQNDMKSLMYKNVPYKETSLQVSGGSLTVHDDDSATSSMIIDVGGSVIVPEYKFGQLIYESDAGESIIGLENGAVFTRMEFQTGSAMLAEPRWFIDNNTETGNRTFIVTLVKISSDSPMSRNGIGTVKMQLLPPQIPIIQYIGSSEEINVKYKRESGTYNFTKGWDNYFTSLDKNVVKSYIDSTTTEYTFSGINEMIVKQYEIKIISI